MLLTVANFIFALEAKAKASVSIKAVYFDDGSGSKRVSETSLSNIIDITVLTNSRVDEVKVNGIEAKKKAGEWDVYNVELKTGKNKIQVTATDTSNKDKKTEKYEINYLGGNVPGINYVINDLSSANKNLKMFDGALQLRLPKQNAVVYNGKVAAYQRVKFLVTAPVIKPSADTNYISNIFTVSTDYSNNCTINGEAELTFEYDPQVSGTDSYLLTVLRLEPRYISNGFSFPLVQNLGGVVDTNSNTITVKMKNEVFGSYVVVKKIGDFMDFYPQGGKKSPVTWSRPYVLALWAKGVMEPLDRYANGEQVKQGYFGLIDNNNAETPITRGEMANLLVKALQLPNTIGDSIAMPTFTDLSQMNLFERMPIETATRNGLFSGFPGKNGGLEFRPDAPLTREQAGIALARATGMELPDPTKASAYCKAYFKDYESITEWACPYIIISMQEGLLQTAEPGYMRPAKPFSRTDAARAIYLLMMKRGMM